MFYVRLFLQNTEGAHFHHNVLCRNEFCHSVGISIVYVMVVTSFVIQ